jgi:ABC-type multidrug transport system fused ATPase/permease subunit
MRENRAVVVARIGEQRYADELAVLEHLEIQEDVEGVFQGCRIDHRDPKRAGDTELGPGYHQQVGAEGCRLSLDQKQRLAIARALVFKPKVLLVDDAILGYNEGGAQKVRVALEGAMKDNTAILFTERANYASRLVDKLFVVEHGRIVEQGSFDALKKQHGALARLIMNE